MWFHELIARYRRWQSIRETIAALECLPTTELDDLGFGRWRIPDIAESHAGYQRGASGPRPVTPRSESRGTIKRFPRGSLLAWPFPDRRPSCSVVPRA